MRWSLRLFSVSGIGIYLHWTFLLIVGYVIWSSAHLGPAHTVAAVALVLALFVCVTLHELGHALMAQHYGIRTRDITLLVIGGVARIERIPDNPRQELWIAVAGPLVNVIIAIMLFLGLWLGGRLPRTTDEMMSLVGPTAAPNVTGSLIQLLYVNVVLVLFNLLPAFPMDGGRVLRALLAHWTDYARATHIASSVGQVMAMLFVAWGLLFGGGPFVVLIGIFVFFGAQSESRLAEVRSDLSGVPVRDAMLTKFITLPADATLATASGILLAGAQQDFPVMDGERIAGVLARNDLIRALAATGPDTPVVRVMRTDCPPVEETDRLFRVFQRMQEAGCPLVPVTRRGQLVGLITLENVGELMMIKSALRQAPRSAPQARPAFPV